MADHPPTTQPNTLERTTMGVTHVALLCKYGASSLKEKLNTMHFRSGCVASLLPGVNSSNPINRVHGFVRGHGWPRHASTCQVRTASFHGFV